MKTCFEKRTWQKLQRISRGDSNSEKPVHTTKLVAVTGFRKTETNTKEIGGAAAGKRSSRRRRGRVLGREIRRVRLGERNNNGGSGKAHSLEKQTSKPGRYDLFRSPRKLMLREKRINTLGPHVVFSSFNFLSKM